MSDYLCHDFKTPRTDTSRRLPNSFRVIPIAFYLAMAAGAYFVTMDIIGYQSAKQEKERQNQVKAQHDAEKARHESEFAALDTEAQKGTHLAKWVEATRSIQPVCVKITRNVPVQDGTTITELALERNEQLPSQIGLSMKLTDGNLSQVKNIEAAIEQLNYRAYSPQQSTQNGQIEYKSNLVWLAK